MRYQHFQEHLASRNDDCSSVSPDQQLDADDVTTKHGSHQSRRMRSLTQVNGDLNARGKFMSPGHSDHVHAQPADSSQSPAKQEAQRHHQSNANFSSVVANMVNQSTAKKETMGVSPSPKKLVKPEIQGVNTNKIRWSRQYGLIDRICLSTVAKTQVKVKQLPFIDFMHLSADHSHHEWSKDTHTESWRKPAASMVAEDQRDQTVITNALPFKINETMALIRNRQLSYRNKNAYTTTANQVVGEHGLNLESCF